MTLPNDTSIPRTIVKALDKEVRDQLELARTIKHPGESGRARENILRQYIRELVPESLGIDTGFVIDARGAISKQIDIVIYRTDYYPIFHIGGIKHFLVEGVIAVIENKAGITSVTELQEAFDNISSVKTLDRTGNGRHIVLDTLRSPVDRSDFRHQVFGAIVTQQSLAKEHLKAEFVNFVKSRSRNEWPNLYVDVNGFSMYYARSRQAHDYAIGDRPIVLTANPQEAERLFISNPAASETCSPLADLAQELLNFIRVAVRIDFLLTSYLWVESRGTCYPIS
jgi:hypothetical protein